MSKDSRPVNLETRERPRLRTGMRSPQRSSPSEYARRMSAPRCQHRPERWTVPWPARSRRVIPPMPSTGRTSRHTRWLDPFPRGRPPRTSAFLPPTRAIPTEKSRVRRSTPPTAPQLCQESIHRAMQMVPGTAHRLPECSQTTPQTDRRIHLLARAPPRMMARRNETRVEGQISRLPILPLSSRSCPAPGPRTLPLIESLLTPVPTPKSSPSFASGNQDLQRQRR